MPKTNARKAPANSKAPLKRLTCKQVIAELKANGSEQTIKIYRNHGATGKAFGVSYAFLKELIKRIKTDHELALELWNTGFIDARVIACWAADSDRTTLKMLNSWAREVNDHGQAYEVVGLTQDTEVASKAMDQWIARKAEWMRCLGWGVAARLVMQPGRGPAEGGLSEDRVGELLALIEETIHGAPNRTRHDMNGALIAIGCRPKWKAKALRAAKNIGKIEVDYGKTSCKVIDAAERIEKTTSHYAKKGLSPTDGAGGTRRRHC